MTSPASSPVDYERGTRSAYQSRDRAVAYRRHQTEEWSWARFATWWEHRAVKRVLARSVWMVSDRVLDVPCGTGALARVLNRFAFRVVAVDISREMMIAGGTPYARERFSGFLQGDLLRLPFRSQSCTCVIALGFMHRVPAPIRTQALRELTRTCSRSLIISYSLDSPAQRLKMFLLRRLRPTYRPAPSPATLDDIRQEMEGAGLKVVDCIRILPLLSASIIFVLEKRP
jgi:SAM-dependent methyltransferase